MQIFDYVRLVRDALELYWNTSLPQRRSAQVAAIRAAFYEQDPFTRALLTRFYPDRSEITLDMQAWIFEGRKDDDPIVKAFKSFATALITNGAFTEEELAKYVTPTSSLSPELGIIGAEWTPCPFCHTCVQVRRKGGSYIYCPVCGARIYVTTAGKRKLHVKVVDGGTQVMPHDLDGAYRTLGVLPQASSEEVNAAFLKRLNICRLDRLHSPEQKNIGKAITRSVIRAYEMITSMPPVPLSTVAPVSTLAAAPKDPPVGKIAGAQGPVAAAVRSLGLLAKGCSGSLRAWMAL